MSASAGTQVALLGASGRHAAAPRLRVRSAAEQPLVRLATFAALALYGTLRWSSLLSGGSGKLLVLWALAVLVAGAGLLSRSPVVAMGAAILGAFAAFAIAGVPVSWVVNLRVAVTAKAIGDGLSALPRASVPYIGVNEWVRTVNRLGAGVLLFDAALLLAFAPRALGDLRRAGAALPLIALVAVPATLMHPKLPYLDGLMLFALLAAFMWGERVHRDQAGMAIGLCALAAVGGMFAAPALERHKPWLNYQALTGGLAPAHLERFDWSQTYGPVHWPRKGRAVLEVQAKRATYWKAENLDLFDGTGWSLGTVFQGGDQLATVSPASLRRWTETLQVTVGRMTTNNVIGAGAASAPHLPGQTLFAGVSPGTWTTASQLEPGDSYSIQVYAPDPTATQLASAGDQFPWPGMSGYLTIAVPVKRAPARWVVFPPFHSTEPPFVQQSATAKSPAYGPTNPDVGVVRVTSPSARQLMLASPYANAYELARRLAGSSRTPYAFVTAIENYLARGYTYNEDPPPSRYPLESFLFSSKEGYCQQFAGAMALLLRMGGVPARVAVGFTPGQYDSANKQYVVSDLNAHAWVEAWFPHYGWVKRDPTPPQDPALGGHLANVTGASTAAATTGQVLGAPTKRPAVPLHAGARHSSSAKAGGGIGALEIVAIVVALTLVGVLARGTRPLPRGEAMLAELERALARTGRPMAAGTTLAGLERRLGAGTEAAAYVRALRLQRFGARAEQPTPGQRRALRAQLRAGFGPLAGIRALWALPPRRRAGEARAHRPWRA